MKSKLTLIAFFLIMTNVRGQTYNSARRQSISDSTTRILTKFDSILKVNPTLEFKTVGESGRRSHKFLLYSKLVYVATEDELLKIIRDSKEYAATRGYAYMAYALKCDTENRKEKEIKQNFMIHTLNVCIGYTMTFKEFKIYCRQRNIYDPSPRKANPDPEERKVIKEENTIRKEQGQNKRKE